MKKTDPRPGGIPAHITGEARRMWTRLVDDYGISDAGGVALLRAACEAFQRGEQARRILRREGAVIRDRFGQPKAHPATLIERDSRSQLVAALRALKLSPQEGI